MWPLSESATDEAIERAAVEYRGATPFPHVVLDRWFDEDALREVERSFARRDGWKTYEDGKRANMDVVSDPFFRETTGVVLDVVRRITGRASLVPDPTLRGGGLHEVGRGGRLGIHVDFNRHPSLPLRRCVNTLIYLNESWPDAWHGHLVLTNRAGDVCRTIAPTWNRWVIFDYGPDSWHGHPTPLACPSDHPRRSAAVYYYEPLDDASLVFHTTRYA